jgi:hypothetical protein
VRVCGWFGSEKQARSRRRKAHGGFWPFRGHGLMFDMVKRV